MNLQPISIDDIRLGKPLPVALRSADGALMARRGYVITSREELEMMISRGRSLCIDVDESDDSHRSYVGRLQEMMLDDKPLGQIASVRITTEDLAPLEAPVDIGPPDWLNFQERANTLLRQPTHPDFLPRLKQLDKDLQYHFEIRPDESLLALIYLTATDTRYYSATHSMLVSAACSITARDVLFWDTDTRHSLALASLTMNVSMTGLQDMLAVQSSPLTNDQIRQIEQHAERSVALLKQQGVEDEMWIEGVRRHHDRMPGPLSEKLPAERIARLIQRADMFTARMAPRVTRSPLATTAIMHASYYDEDRKPDEAGGALIKGVGAYPPGTFVRLANGEIAIVLQRGATFNSPKVAVVINRQGMPMGEYVVRETDRPNFRVASSIAHKDIRVKLSLDRLLSLV